MKDTVMMFEMSSHEYKRRLLADDAIILLPVGAVEQHGHHLPVGTDFMMATYMATRAAEIVGGIVAPPISYAAKSGVRTGGGNHQPGTTSLDGITLITVVKDVLKEFARHGARKIGLIDGHFENRFFLDEACDIAVRDLRLDGIDDVKVLKMIYAAEFPQELLDRIYIDIEFPGLDLEHGGILETSMMLYCFPDLVDLDLIPEEKKRKFPAYDLYPGNPAWVPPSGNLSSGRGSSVEKGKILVETFVQQVVDALLAEFR